VLAGEAVARHFPPVWIKRAAGALFIALGIWTLLQAKAA
jgi:putative Ca2+/H+ antiporter (TMEM165/GDT1 family)